MRKIIKIGFWNFWQGFESAEGFYRLFPYLKPFYDIKVSEYPDYFIYSNTSMRQQPRLMLENKKPFPKDITTIFFDGEYLPHINPNLSDFSFTCLYLDHPKHFRLPYYAHRMNYQNNPNFVKLLIKDSAIIDIFKNRRNNFCNFLYSNNIPYRNDFFHALSNYKHIDSGGKCLNNMNDKQVPDHAMGTDYSHCGKYNFIQKYKFTIAFENDRSDINNGLGYVTEKLTDPMIAGSIPIYWGDPEVDRVFNTKSFVNVRDFTKAGKIDFDEVIDYVKHLDNDDKAYCEMLEQPWFHDNKLPNHLDEQYMIRIWQGIFK